jgi:hypothetical protein
MSKRVVSRSAVGVGLSTLVTIMVAVLLTTFSVLTLVSARADLSLSQKAVSSTQAYYAADGKAEQWLAKVDTFAQQTHDDLVGDLTTAGYQPSVDDDGQLRIGTTIPIDDKRDLIVEVALDSTGGLDILRWQSVPKPREQ